VHVVGAEPPDLALAALRRVRASGTPVVVTPLAPVGVAEAAWEARVAIQAVAHRVDEAATLPLLAAFATRRLAVDGEPTARALAEEAAADRRAIRAEADAVCGAPPFVEDGAPFAIAFDALVVAAIEPRANLIAVARAATDAGLRLALVGPIVDPAYFAYVAAFGGPGFTYFGDVPDADAARFAASARVYVDASFAPRGGARVLAAARAGIPVVTAGRDDLPWLAGEGATTVDPTAIEALAGGLAQAARLTDRVRARLAERIPADASPAAATRTVLALYAALARRDLNSPTASADTLSSIT
jgi:hypothetical protein